MYLQPQTVYKHTLTEITELAAIFGGMLTVAKFLHSTGIGTSTVSGWVMIHICEQFYRVPSNSSDGYHNKRPAEWSGTIRWLA